MNVTVRECQDTISEVMRRTGWDKRSPEDQGCGLAEESGEVCKALIQITRNGISPQRKEELALELADTFMYLLWIGQMYDIDLGEAFQRKAVRVAGGILQKEVA
jgi:NTP pyrophosphatase (non-canonical NTP hydrolase)